MLPLPKSIAWPFLCSHVCGNSRKPCLTPNPQAEKDTTDRDAGSTEGAAAVWSLEDYIPTQPVATPLRRWSKLRFFQGSFV
jgi:hypothetical protein